MAETKNGAATAESEDSKRQRSPSYPVIAIDEALSKVKAIYSADRRAFTTGSAILEHMGYKVKDKPGGRSARVVASLRQYGLLEGRGNRYRVSDAAFRILELPEDSPERLGLLKQAAFSPPIVSKILKHYQGEIPSDTTLRSHLVLEEEFNPDSAEEFIKVLRRTISIVNPDVGDYNGESSEGVETPPPAGGSQRMQQITPPSQITPPPKPPSGQRPFPLYLSKEQEAVLYVPSVMSRAEYELLKKQLENSLLVMEATSVVDSAPLETNGGEVES
jgi:hypothetical protein